MIESGLTSCPTCKGDLLTFPLSIEVENDLIAYDCPACDWTESFPADEKADALVLETTRPTG